MHGEAPSSCESDDDGGQPLGAQLPVPEAALSSGVTDSLPSRQGVQHLHLKSQRASLGDEDGMDG